MLTHALRKAPIRRILLHVDVNKTVAMMDGAGRKSVRDVCVELGAENAWGLAPRTPHSSDLETTPSWTRPALSVSGDRLGSAAYVNYKTFVDTIKMPYPPGKLDPDAAAQLKRDRAVLTTSYGEPGSETEDHDAWAHALALMDVLEQSPDPFLIPSFVAFLHAGVDALISEETQLDAIGLVFRTFGSETGQLASALARVGEEGVEDARRSGDERMMEAYRGLINPRGRGKISRGPGDSDVVLEMMEGDDVGVVEGMDVHRTIRRMMGEPGLSVAFIQDDFPFWSSAGEDSAAGKVFFLSQSERGKDVEGGDVYEAFLDDNLRPERERSIVDVRYVDDPALPHADQFAYARLARDRVLIKVDPSAATLDRCYFTTVVAQGVGTFV